MAFNSSFIEIPLAEAHTTAERMKADGARFVQILAVTTDDGIDLYYTYDVDGTLENYKVAGLTHDDPVPSITDVFLAAFVFENEARELFGVDMRDVAIDFGGHMYSLAETEPMTFLSPELAAAKEKARKAAAAKAAKEAKDAAAKPAPKVKTKEELEAEIQAKTAGMDPEKAAKVRAALEAKAVREAAEAAAAAEAVAEKPQAKSNADIEAKLAGMDPEKAAKVRAALEAKAAREAAAAADKGAE